MAKTLEQISYNMSRIRSCGTVHEKRLCAVLCRRGFYSFERNVRDIPGQPDIVFRARRLAVFCDGDFWHGYDWEHRRDDLKSNRSYWIPKIERNMVHDRAVTFSLRAQGWTVMRFWEHEIKKDADDVADRIEAYLRRIPLLPYRIAELNAGIGELRLALELKAACVSVLAAESSRLARRAYAERFGMSPLSIPSVSEAKRLLAHQTVDIVLAHLSDMPNARRRRLKCPPFSDSDILALIESSRPSAFLLAGAFRSVTSKSERRVRQLLRRLVMALNYQILGCSWNADAEPVFDLDALVCEENAGEKGGRRSLFLLGLDRERFGDGAEADAGTLPAVVLSGEDSANEEDSAARADDDNSSEGCAGPDEAGGYTAALNGEQRSTLKKRAHSLGVLLPLAMRIADILKAGAG